MRKFLIRSMLATTLALGAVTLVATDAHAALNAYLKLKGSKTGPLKGSVTQKGREGQIRVVSFSHDVVSPRDTATGQSTGKRQHRPFVVTVEVDRAMPLLYQAWANDERLTEWTMPVWMPTPEGREVVAYEVTLTGATITEIRLHSANDIRSKDTLEISFVYDKITWNSKEGATVASDSWNQTADGHAAPARPPTKKAK